MVTKENCRKMIVAFLITTVFVSVNAFADWTTESYVDTVYVGYSDGSVYMQGPDKINSYCSQKMIEFKTDTDKIQRLLMAALVAGKKVKCNVLMGSTNCTSAGYQKGDKCRIIR